MLEQQLDMPVSAAYSTYQTLKPTHGNIPQGTKICFVSCSDVMSLQIWGHIFLYKWLCL